MHSRLSAEPAEPATGESNGDAEETPRRRRATFEVPRVLNVQIINNNTYWSHRERSTLARAIGNSIFIRLFRLEIVY